MVVILAVLAGWERELFASSNEGAMNVVFLQHVLILRHQGNPLISLQPPNFPSLTGICVEVALEE
jgi:hypothetical protein